ncbi:MAG TPA: hypothetical protein PKC91_12055 [Ignavibacteria bacterium]|nr:hypothetical protein [Ignavibacteria bacterium]
MNEEHMGCGYSVGTGKAVEFLQRLLSGNNNLPEYVIGMLINSVKLTTKIANAKSRNKKLDYSELKEAESVDSFFIRKKILEKMKELL